MNALTVRGLPEDYAIIRGFLENGVGPVNLNSCFTLMQKTGVEPDDIHKMVDQLLKTLNEDEEDKNEDDGKGDESKDVEEKDDENDEHDGGEE